MSDPEPVPQPPRFPNVWGSGAQRLVIYGATIVGLYICYRLLLPFLAPVVWAMALAVLCTPAQRWFESRIKSPNLATSVAVLLVVLVIVGPATFAGQRLVMEASKGTDYVKTQIENGEWRRAMDAHPALSPLSNWVEQHIDLRGTVSAFSNWLGATALSLVRGSVIQIIHLCLTFYMLFYFLRDRNEALQGIRYLSPLSGEQMDRVFSRVTDTIYATVYGTLAVSAVQGSLGGLMFWWLGLPAPVLWGFVMALLAVVPVLGAFVIWIPAAFFLGLSGSWGKALLLTIWGGVVIGSIDNLLYPIFVGSRLKMHTVLAFISIVGGLMLFGPCGLLLGPVALTLTQLLLEIWSADRAREA